MIDYYSQRRSNSSLDGKTPDEVYWKLPMAGLKEAAAFKIINAYHTRNAAEMSKSCG